MQVTTPAIVLSALKYADTSLIARLYTREMGTQSYMLKGIRNSKKGKLRTSFFQPLTQLVIETKHKGRGQLEFIKEARVHPPYTTMHTDVIKSSITLFFSEVLTQVLVEQPADESLYDYLSAAFTFLDQTEGVANFSIKVLLDISAFMGFAPVRDEGDRPYFNLLDGTFDHNGLQPNHTTELEAHLLKRFIGTTFEDAHHIKMNRAERSRLLAVVIDYFQIHLHVFKKPESLSYLRQLFD